MRCLVAGLIVLLVGVVVVSGTIIGLYDIGSSAQTERITSLSLPLFIEVASATEVKTTDQKVNSSSLTISVPYHHKDQCIVSAYMMVLNYWGIHATEQEIRSIIGGNPGDEVNIRIATPKVAEHYHLDYEVIYPSIIDWDGATIQDLKDRLNQGRPVIACIEADDKNPSDPDHALVVLGYDESKGVYFTSGTYFGNGYVFSKDEFEKRYRNEIHVLTPKKDYYKDKPITNIKLKFKVGDDWVDEPPEWVSEKFEIDVELNNQGFDAQGGWIGFESYNHSKGETTAKISVLPWASKRTDYYGETQYSYFGWYKSLIGPDKDNKAPTGMHFTTNPDFERYLYTVPHLDSKHSLNFTVRYDVTANHRDYLHILVDANLMNFNGMDYEKVELSIPIDKIEPDSTISWPEDGGIYNTSIIKTHFSADDIAGGREDSGVAYIYYKMDADSWKKISYSGGAVNIDYTLSDGRHTFYVKDPNQLHLLLTLHRQQSQLYLQRTDKYSQLLPLLLAELYRIILI